MTFPHDTFEPPDSPAVRRRRRRRRVVLGVVALLLVAAVGVGVRTLLTSCGGPGSGVKVADGECVGVTDGSYVFDEAYRDVEQKIAAENRWVDDTVRDPARKPDRAVTVALLDPMTPTDSGPLSVDEVRNRMEGAYTAQYRANHSTVVGDPDPLVRLVLANEGSHQQQWPRVVAQLVAMKDAQAPLSAVVGLGISIDETAQAAKALSDQEIPTIGAVTTADQLNNERIPNFLRVSPSNRDYVTSLRQYLGRHPQLDSAILVYDSNSRSRGDIFVESLRDDLKSEMKDLIKYSDQSFVGRSIPSSSNPGLFQNITSNICAVAPKIVFFAGRKIDLHGFLDSLGTRVCRSTTPLTVITVDADPGVFDHDEQALKDDRVTVVYADATDPRGWLAGTAGTPPHFAEFAQAYQQLGFPARQLDDGGAISSHDAVLTAVKATRLAGEQLGPKLPSAADVSIQLLNLNIGNEIPGASGTMSFSNRGARSGDPVHKPVPIQQFPASEDSRAAGEQVYLTGD